MTKTRKILGIVLALIVLTLAMSISIFAQDTETGTLTNAYTSGSGYWGECGGSADESFGFKLYNDDTYMGSTFLNNVGGIIDGDVHVSWSIMLDAESNADEYWTMSWDIAPTIEMQPNRVEQWVDGVKVAECVVEPNWSDSIFPVVAAVTDEDGKILSYVNGTKSYTLADAFGNGGNIVILRNIEESFTSLENVTLSTNVAGGVTITNTYADDYVDFNNVTIGNGVTLNIPYVLSNGSDSVNVIEGTLNVGTTYYHSRNAKTTIQNGGKVTTGGMTVMRYNTAADAGIYIYGDNDATTVEFSCANTIGTYSGTFYVKDAVVEANQMWLDFNKAENNKEDSSYAQLNATFENSIVNVTAELKLYEDASLTLVGSNVSAKDVQIRANATPVVAMDENSTIKANMVTNLAGASLNAALGEDGTVSFKTVAALIGTTSYTTLAEAFAALKEGDTLTILAGEHSEGTIKLPASLKDVTIKGNTGAILKDMSIQAADGNSINYVNLTFDNITFDNSNIVITGWKNSTEIVKNLTVTNCVFKNIVRTGNIAALHLNVDPADPVNGLTFTNNVIDGISGSSNSGIYTTGGITGNIVVSNNTINNVTFRPFILNVQNNDGIADELIVTGNTFSGSPSGRAQALGTGSDGTDTVSINVNNNIFKDITNDFQICFWKFNPETTTTDLSCNYYDVDIVANSGLIYYNGSAGSAEDLIDMGIFPIYKELNEDGTIDESSAYTYVPAENVAQVGDEKFATLVDAVAAVKANGGTLKLLADANESITFNYPADGAPVAITFDLNGYTITSAESTLWVSDGYVITVKDSVGTGKLITTSTEVEAITIKRGGQVVLESGYVYAPAYTVYLYSGSSTGNEKFTMIGGTVDAPNGGLAIGVGAGKVIINGGKVLCNKVIGGGGWSVLVYEAGALEITGGEFLGTIGNYDGSISISGGTFSYCDDPNDGFNMNHLAAGYATKTNADGSITVYALPTSLSGSGTAEDPYLINNIDDLKFFRDSVNNGTRYNGQFVKLNADIDLNGEEWTPIGDREKDQGSFLGTFDGGNHTISNLYISKYAKTGAGFFSKVGMQTEYVSGTVKNLTFNNVTIISSQSYVGVIAQAPSGALIDNVNITGNVNISGYGYVGGIVGHGYPTINNCSVTAEGSITANYWGAGAILGFAGDYGAKINNATVSGVNVHANYGGAAAVAGSPYGAKLEGATVKNVAVTSNSDYCMGYVVAGGSASNVTMENVTATANGNPITPADVVASVNDELYFSLEEAFAAAVEGDTIVLLADATPALKSQRAITKASVIDLNGKTLTLTEDDLYFGTTTFKNGTIVVDPSVKPSTAVFWMFANQTLTFDAVKLVATGVTGTYLIGLDGNNADLNIVNGSEIIADNETALDLDIICVNSSTGNDIVVDNSKVTVNNLDGRVFFRGNYTISGASEINLSGITKAGFRIEAGQTLSIEDTSVVTITGEPRDGGIHVTDATATYTKADTATVTATVNVPVEYVAQIGDVKYETLADAFAAIGAGDVVIELLKDATLDYNAREAYGLAETTSVTINGNGHVLTLNQKNSDWSSIGFANADAKLVLNNMTIEKTGYGDTSGAWNTHAIIFKCNVEMNNVTVNNSVAVQNGATLNNVTINEANGYYGLWINANGQSVTMNGGAINATNGGRGIKVADQYVDSVAKVELSITGTKFNTANKAAVLVTSPKGANITASNVDITNVAADNTSLVWVDETYAANFGETTVVGGTVSQEDASNFAIIVKDGDKAVSYFKTLDELFDNVSAYAKVSNVTVELLGDVVATKVVKTNSLKTYNFVTNVAEGVTMDLQYADGWNYFRKVNIGENITVKVKYLVFSTESTIAGTVDAYYPYINGGKVTVAETGTLKYAGGDALQVKGNGAVLTVKGTVIAPTINVWVGNAQLVISGENAKVESNWIDIWDGAPTVTVENGATLDVNAIKVSRGGEITVNNATLDANSIEVGHNGNSAGKLTESGNSTIKGEIKMTATGSTVASDGGLNVTTTVENSLVKYVDGAYVVVKAAAKIGDVYYETIADAINAANPGDTLTLLADAEINTSIVVTSDLTIDGNGHKITVTGAYGIDIQAAEVDLVINNLTIESSLYALNMRGVSDNSTVEINNSNLTGCIALNVWGENVVITANNSNFTSVDNATHENYSAVVLNNNGSVSAEKTVITINGGSITALDENGKPSIAVRNATATGKTNISNETVVTGEIKEIVAIITYSGQDPFYSYFTLQEAIDRAANNETATVKLLCDITVNEALVINGKVVIDLNGKTVTSTAKRAFEVYADATIKNGTIVGANRCVDTRTAVKLTLEDLTLVAENYTSTYGNPQPLTIGGSVNGTVVTMSNVNINAGKSGYGIISFVETDLTAKKCEITGFAALYVKAGSEGSEFTFNGCTLTGNIGTDVEDNSFGTIVLETNKITVTVDKDSTITANGNYMCAIAVGTSNYDVTGNTVTVLGTINIINGNIISIKDFTNTVKVKAEYADELVNAGYSASEEDENGLVTVEKDEIPTLTKAETALLLEENFKMSFYFPVDQFVDGVNYFAMITKHHVGTCGDPDEITYVAIDMTKIYNADNYGASYRVVADNIAAKEMNCEISCQVFAGEMPENVNDENTAVSIGTVKDSIYEYAMWQLENSNDEKLKALIVDVLNYGAAAQVYFNHYETVLANRGLTDEQKDSSVLPEGYVYQNVTKMYGPHATEYVGVSSALILEASVHMIFDLVDMDNLVDPTVVVEFTHNGESAKQHHVVYRIDDEEHPLIIDANGVARIVVDDLAAVDAQVTVHCSVYDGEATAENLLYTVDDSVESYCGWGASTSDAELAAVCERIIKYSQSAKAYFNK